MTAPAIVDQTTARTIVGTLGRYQWSWTVADLPTLLAGLGWDLVEQFEEGAVVRAPWALIDNRIAVMFDGDQVADITFDLTALADPSPAQTQFCDDAFATLTALGHLELGSPSQTQPGEQPMIRWRNETATVALTNTGQGIELAWSSNTWQDRSDDLERQ